MQYLTKQQNHHVHWMVPSQVGEIRLIEVNIIVEILHVKSTLFMFSI